jgi:tRNA(Ile2) C34 agmatinyltransferase TiaS
MEKSKKIMERQLDVGLIQPPPDAWRHLFKPAGLELPSSLVISRPFFGNKTE